MTENKLHKPKFKVGDVVWMKDEEHFNPVNEVISIGLIEAIHIYKGESLMIHTGAGKCKPENLFGRITYSVSGFSIRAEEKDLQLFEEENKIESLPNADKELELLREYTSYVAVSREEEFEPLEYDSWKETNYPSGRL